MKRVKKGPFFNKRVVIAATKAVVGIVTTMCVGMFMGWHVFMELFAVIDYAQANMQVHSGMKYVPTMFLIGGVFLMILVCWAVLRVLTGDHR